MIATTLALGVLLLGAERELGDPPGSAADRVVLRDGSVVLGVINATTPGPRGCGIHGPSRLGRKGRQARRPSSGTARLRASSGRPSPRGESGSKRGGAIDRDM